MKYFWECKTFSVLAKLFQLPHVATIQRLRHEQSFEWKRSMATKRALTGAKAPSVMMGVALVNPTKRSKLPIEVRPAW
jgi:hypothetical protein